MIMLRSIVFCAFVCLVAGDELMPTHLMKGEVSNPTISQPQPRLGTDPGRLLGTFAPPCQATSWFDHEAGNRINVSSMKTLKYNYNGTFEVDYTEYTGESAEHACNPSKTEVFAKYHMKGTIDNHGFSKLDKRIHLAEWTHTWSQWFFPTSQSPQVREILSVMNQQCKCGGVWVAGKERIVDAQNDCSAEEKAETNQFYLCQIVTGKPGYGVYKWLDANTYTSSPIRFDSNVGWSTTEPTSPGRRKVPMSGSTNPKDCDYVDWSECGDHVSEAAEFCDTCEGLECEGCLYRHVDAKLFSQCCPCIWYYAKQHTSASWMQIPC